MSIEQIREAALALPRDERLELADTLYCSLMDQSDPESLQLHPDWEAELNRRSEELESGKVPGIPWEDVRKELEELF